jgi:hypothetical protein
MSNGHYNVLFLSNRNTARSIFAEAVMKREHFTGFSAGMRPADQLDPLARDVLRTKQYPTDGLYPKHWSQFAKPNALPLDFVFALCDPTAGAVVRSPRIGAIPIPKICVENYGSDARSSLRCLLALSGSLGPSYNYPSDRSTRSACASGSAN